MDGAVSVRIACRHTFKERRRSSSLSRSRSASCVAPALLTSTDARKSAAGARAVRLPPSTQSTRSCVVLGTRCGVPAAESALRAAERLFAHVMSQATPMCPGLPSAPAARGSAAAAARAASRSRLLSARRMLSRQPERAHLNERAPPRSADAPQYCDVRTLSRQGLAYGATDAPRASRHHGPLPDHCHGTNFRASVMITAARDRYRDDTTSRLPLDYWNH